MTSDLMERLQTFSQLPHLEIESLNVLMNQSNNCLPSEKKKIFCLCRADLVHLIIAIRIIRDRAKPMPEKRDTKYLPTKSVSGHDLNIL